MNAPVIARSLINPLDNKVHPGKGGWVDSSVINRRSHLRGNISGNITGKHAAKRNYCSASQGMERAWGGTAGWGKAAKEVY